MRRCHQPIITAFLLLSLSSCEQYYYIPNAHNVPLFQEKGEIRASAAKSEGNPNPSEYQAAYALTNHIGLMANGFIVPFFSKNPTFNDGAGYLIEGGAGYFTKINKHWVFETYSGYGAGNVQNIYYESEVYAGRTKMNINRVFIQPTFGYTGDYFDCAFSNRMSGIWYTNVRLYDITDKFTYGPSMEMMRKNIFTQFEPAFTMRGGWKYVKLQLQYGLSINMNNPDFSYVQDNLNLGIYLSFAEKFKHKQIK